jgi:hypothetical protein
MTHQLDFIKKSDILRAIKELDKANVPGDNEWSEYWIKHNNEYYQFKYVIQVASNYTKTPILTTDFTSNDSSRRYVATLGFHITYISTKNQNQQKSYWVGASYYGKYGNQTDKFKDFIKNKYWRTDHDLRVGEGLKIYNELKKVKINDRICIRYFDKKGGNVKIEAIGTIKNEYLEDGKIDVIWDFNPPKYSGPKPTGLGSGNWWKTLFQIKKQADISLIFNETLIEKRIARLAWNDNGWVMPSGAFGKSDNIETHEGKHGYGHEEWVFDTSKLIKGFHYGFLEPIRQEQDAYSNKLYNVWLYSINGETKKRFWIGEIKNLFVIDSVEAEKVNQTYIEKGWLNDMEAQIKASGANVKGFSNWRGLDFFNVKFKPCDIFINDPYFELSDTHPIYDQSRYTFAHFKDEYEIKTGQAEDDFGFTPPMGNDEDSNDDPKTKTHHRQPKAVEIVYLHKAISNSLTKVLQHKFGKENVKKEHSAGYGTNKIDIVVREKNKMTFYEIKTFLSLKTSIREAFGQLMEYCYYPDKNKAKELIVVTQVPVNKQTKTYFENLRNRFGIPIYYQSYDLETKTLSEKS